MQSPFHGRSVPAVPGPQESPDSTRISGLSGDVESRRRARPLSETFAAAARRVGLTPTGFCAQAALVAATASPTERPLQGGDGTNPRAEALAELQVELAALRTAVTRVGTNLNQAVAALNTRGEAPVWLRHVVEQCGRALATVYAAASKVHRRLP